MSGFEFEVTAGDGTSMGRHTTAADGRTPPIVASAGTYEIRETARPPWGAGLGDAGAVRVDLEPATGSDVHEVEYTNTVPDASIVTSARDAADGDRVVDLEHTGATIIDIVTYRGLVPGTDYIVTGELMLRPTVAPTEMIPTAITGSTRFAPIGPAGSVAVEFVVPADPLLVGHAVVVYQRLMVASSGRVIATHADPHATAQTIRFARPVAPVTTSTTIPVTAPPTTTRPAIVEPRPPSSQPPPPTTTTAPPAALPRTGTDSSRSLAITALALVLAGGTLLSTARRPTSRRR